MYNEANYRENGHDHPRIKMGCGGNEEHWGMLYLPEGKKSRKKPRKKMSGQKNPARIKGNCDTSPTAT